MSKEPRVRIPIGGSLRLEVCVAAIPEGCSYSPLVLIRISFYVFLFLTVFLNLFLIMGVHVSEYVSAVPAETIGIGSPRSWSYRCL